MSQPRCFLDGRGMECAKYCAAYLEEEGCVFVKLAKDHMKFLKMCMPNYSTGEHPVGAPPPEVR
jgi:hypothetical protein